MLVNIVFLDAGHGGSDSGAYSSPLCEKDMNLVTTLECKRVLELHGVIVKLSRPNDIYVGINERAAMANAANAGLCVSIHYNAGGGDGAEAICSIHYGVGTELANNVVNAIHTYTGQNTRNPGVYSKAGSNGDYFGIIRETNMPSIIVEAAFIDSADAAIVDTVPEQQLVGRAIAYGVLKQLGIAIKSEAGIEASSPATVTSKPQNNPVISYSSDSAKNIQAMMNRLKIGDDSGSPLVVDGDLGSKSKQAIRKFEIIMGLSVDEGLWGPQCQAAYDVIVSKPLVKYSDKYNMISRYVQYRINTIADGYFQNLSVSKLKIWQTNNGLTADGECGPNTWSKLIC